MKNYNEVLAEASRVEYDEKSGKLFLVFEVKSEKFKQYIRTNWTKDLEYKLVDKSLVEINEE